MRTVLTLAAALAMLAPLGVSAADIPSSGALPHGGSYVMYADTTVPTSAIDLWFRAPGAGYDDATPGISRLAATAAAAGTLVSGKTLAQFVHDAGGTLTINVYPDIVGVSIVVPSTWARRTIAAASAAYFDPRIDENALKAAQKDEAVLSVTRKYSSDDLLHDALFAEIFPSGPAHFPPLPGTVAQIVNLSLAQVQQFAARAFRSANATMTLAGNVNAADLAAVTAGTPGKADAPIGSPVAPSPEPAKITGNVSGIGLAWTGPGISDERAATAMDFIADYLFRDRTGVVAKALGNTGDTYVAGQFITLHDPGVMLVTIGGSAAAHAQQLVLDSVAKLATPLDPATFAAAQQAFLYHLGADTQLPVEQADNLGWYAVEGNPSYAPSDPSSSYWRRAEQLDPAYVAAIAKRYLAHPVVVTLTSTSKETAS